MLVKEKLPLYIKRWTDQGESRNISTLSRYSGVPYPTLRRIAAGESEPTINNLMAVGEIVCSRSELTELLGSIAPNIGKYYHEVEVPNSNNISLSMISFLNRQEYHLPLLLCGKASGSTREEVALQCGEIGLMALDEMIETEVIVVRDNKYFLQEDVHILNNRVIKQFISSLIKVYNTDVDSHPHSTINFFFEGFNLATIEELNHEINLLRNKIMNYMKDPLRKGDINWFSGIFANTLDDTKTPIN